MFKINSMEKFAAEILQCQKEFTDIADVRFKPPCVVFENPYEGKKFEAVLVMQNVGKHPVFVRINRPSSSAVFMATLPSGVILAPGMTITRKIKYTSAMASLNKTCIIPIFVDKTVVSYKVYVKISEVLLSTNPHLIDFGCINAGPTTSKRTIDLINSGVKASRFAIDLGQNDLNIVVSPMRGMIMGNSKTTFRVEMNAMEEGYFQSEFWIISQVPLCIKVLVNVVMGEIEAVLDYPMKMFTFLQFPRTYVGVTNTKAVLVKNYSYSASMFYISADFGDEKLHLDAARQQTIDYNFYDVIPSSGRLPPRDCRAFLFRFAPKKQFTSKNDYALAMFTINKLYCNDIDLDRYEDKHLFNEKERLVDTISSSISVSEKDLNIAPIDDLDMDAPRPKPINFFESSLKVLLHGESEFASVSIVPDELVLDQLTINCKENRVLRLTNNSKNLPIFVKYTKTAFVEVKPKFARLNALESKEVSVEITARSYDNCSSRIHFNLLYFDEPRLDDHLKTVGEVSIPFSMTSQIVTKPAKSEHTLVKDLVFDKPLIMTNKLEGLVDENAYVALPDKLPRSLRPWQSDKIFKTLYAALPRYKDAINEFQLSQDEVIRRENNRNYYREFVRRQAEMIRGSLRDANLMENIEDYDISQNAYACLGFADKLERNKAAEVKGNFIPLTPLQMSNIIITPRNTIVDNVVPHSSFLKHLTIRNKNPFAVRIYLMPHKSDLFVFPRGRRKIIWPNSEEKITYECYTEATRIQNHMLDVIVNDCHVYETSISVNIVPKVLDFSFCDGKFLADQPPYKYLEITNNVNAEISFNWDFVADLDVEPIRGVVEPGRSLTCLISYDVAKCTINNYEMVLNMDNRLNQRFRFMLDKLTYETSFTDEVDFGDVGVNMLVQKTAVLSNFCIEPLSFSVEMEEVITGLEVSPSFGQIDPKSTKVFTFSLCKETCEKFTCNMILNVANTTLLPVKITGNVVLPRVVFTPDTVRFKKMSASSFDVKHFKVKNVSNFQVVLQFDNVNMPEMEFRLQSRKKVISNEQFFLEADEEKCFTIHYYPSYLLFTSFSAPILVNKIPVGDKRLKSGLKLCISVLTNKLCVDTWRYDFIYYPYFNFPCVQEHTITIHNPTKSLVTFCIRFDNLKAPFSFEHVEGGICIPYECSIVCQLEAEEDVSFLAKFNPEFPSSYKVSLPLFIRDDFSSDVHNIFVLTGVYPAPEFECEHKKIHLGLIPLNFQILKIVRLELRYHQPNCILKVFNDDLEVKIVHDNVIVNKPIMIHDVKIIFHGMETHIVNNLLQISCSCGGIKEIMCTGATENNFFTNYACTTYFCDLFHKPINALFRIPSMHNAESKSSLSSYFQISMFKNANQHEYNVDYFPDDNSPFRKYMDNVLLALEQWIYEQGFFGSTYYKIPDTICKFETGEFVERLKRTCRLVKFIKLPLFMLLQNLCGPSVNEIFKLEINENESLVSQAYQLYVQLLLYYLEIEGCVSHVEPVYLLPYESYVEMQQELKSEEILTYADFYKISKQYWVDVLSQTLKLFYYKRILCNRSMEATSSHMIQIQYISIANEAVYSDMGNTILCWIKRNWNEQKHLLGSQVFGNNTNKTSIAAKNIKNFEEDLTDGLGLCAVTIACCPYLIKYLYGFYVPPQCKQEYFHNAAKLAQVWKMLNSSYTVMPKNIIEPNSFYMVLLLTYLYEFLMKLRPKDTLYLYTDLSSHCSEHVSIVNENDDQIKYIITFFNNEEGMFSVDTTSLIVPPHSVRKLKVSYFAKFMKKHKATMVLCGESPGGKFTHGKAFNLEGTPQFNSPQTVKTIITRLYHIKEVKVTFSTPYPIEANYQLLSTETPPDDVDDIHPLPYIDIVRSNPIPIVKLKKDHLESDSTGVVEQAMSICSISKQNRKFWIFGHNENIGDFFYIVNIITRINKDMIKIPLALPKGFGQTPCICKDKSADKASCPKLIRFKIPAKNTHLWKVIMSKMIKSSDSNEKLFWKKYQKSEIGLHVVKKLLLERKEYLNPATAHIFNTTVEYHVSVKTDHVHAKQQKVVIKDTTSVSESLELVLHIDKGEPKSIVVHLESTDFKEFRLFKVLTTYDLVEGNDDTQLLN